MSAAQFRVVPGGELYVAALPYASQLYLTLINAAAEADTFFPPYEKEFKIISDESHAGDPSYHFITLGHV